MKFIMLASLVLAMSGCAQAPTYSHAGKSKVDTVLVCHKGKKTLELPREAAAAHINHGDTNGPC